MTDAEWPANDEWAQGPKRSTDAEHAAVLRRHLSETGKQHVNTVASPAKVRAAIERAIELLEREAKPNPFGVDVTWPISNTFDPRTM